MKKDGQGRKAVNPLLWESMRSPELTRVERAALLIMIDGGFMADVDERFGGKIGQFLVNSALKKICVKGHNYNEAERALIEYQKNRRKWSPIGASNVQASVSETD